MFCPTCANLLLGELPPRERSHPKPFIHVRVRLHVCSRAHRVQQGAEILLPGMPLCVQAREKGELYLVGDHVHSMVHEGKSVPQKTGGWEG